MRIISLEVQNFLMLEAVYLEPRGNLTVIAGPNGAGKSSVINAIYAALGGAYPEHPLRAGAKEGFVRIMLSGELGRGPTMLAVHLRIREGGRPQLRITEEPPDGRAAVLRSPRAVLDAMLGAVSFDPLRFARMDPRAQRELLQRVVGLDLDDVENDLADARHMRRALSRARHEEPPRPDGPRPEIASTQALMAELRQAREVRDEILAAAAKTARIDETIAGHRRAIVRLQGERAAFAETAAREAPDVADLEGRLARLDTEREGQAAWDHAMDAYGRWEAAETEWKRADEACKAIDARRTEIIASAPMPLDGLSMGDDGSVTWRGLPIAQASRAEQIRIGVALTVAQNPQLRLAHIEDGSLLDSETLRDIEAMAAENDLYLFVERVADSPDGAPECAVYIEGGRIHE